MYQFIPLHSCDYLKKISIKVKVVTYDDNSWKEIWPSTNDKSVVAVEN